MAASTIKVSAAMGAGFTTNIHCSHPFVIDQQKAGGEVSKGPNPLETFLSSLPACICAIGRIIANQKHINLRGINVDVEGDIDKDFLLGKTTEGRAGFTEIRLYVDIDADLTQSMKQEFLKEIAKRCPIADNIKAQSTVIPVVVEKVN